MTPLRLRLFLVPISTNEIPLNLSQLSIELFLSSVSVYGDQSIETIKKTRQVISNM